MSYALASPHGRAFDSACSLVLVIGCDEVLELNGFPPDRRTPGATRRRGDATVTPRRRGRATRK